MARKTEQATKDFMASYEEECQKDQAYKDAYEQAESKHTEENGHRKFANVDNFWSYRSRYLKRSRK